MTQGFFQFNNSIINEINNFATSSYDLLFFSGEKGSNKSETIEKALETFSANNLIFRQFCFKNSVIDDFLLNFYDALRYFSLAEKISLKKFATDNFKEKVSHYFKSIQQNCIIIVENFENVDENIEIIDFLSYLATFDNVKIIIVTRNSDKNLFRFKKLRINNLMIQSSSKEEFKSKLVLLSEPISEEAQEKFYEATSGLDLYLKMSSRYCSLTNISIVELTNEYERKHEALRIEFDEFLISKYITLIPKQYQTFFKTLCTIPVPVSMDFIQNYNITDLKDGIEYLSNKYLLNFFGDEVFVKDYFSKYVKETFSIQEKVSYYTSILDIYEKELTKSPKDRLLRLSREAIRKEMEDVRNLVPTINSPKTSSSFSYLKLASNNSWQDEKAYQKQKLSEKMQKIKERKTFLSAKTAIEKSEDNFKQKQIEENRQHIAALLNSARDYSNSYKFNDAISELLRAKDLDSENEFEIEILIMLAKNYESLNNYSYAQKIYDKALDIAIKNRDERKTEIEYLIALTDKNLFKMKEAKVLFKQIALNEKNPISYRRKSHLELGEINEAEQNIEEAVKHYLETINLSLGKDKETICKVYYRLGVMYDENGDVDNAIKYYRKNYTTSAEKRENKYYSACLVNLSLIYSESSKYKEALDCLKLALSFDSENNDLENLYYTQKEIAKLYSITDEINSINYYKKALSTAQELKDNFKMALIYFEFAQNYYDKGDDEKALVNFLNAKSLLKNSSDKENIERIDTRIKDIKLRLDKLTFDTILEKYE